MDKFEGRIAVVTGGGTGMGRELARQLAAAGCDVAICDVSAETMAQTKALCEAGAPQGTRVTTHLADVSDETQMLRFAAEVAEQHKTDKIHLLFNNAGIGGGGSVITDSRESWDKTFGVCWYGVYFGVRSFLPMLMAADAGHIVNTSSVNGFWASIGPGIPHTAYSAAKFAVKGFSEALMTDLAVNAPHIKCSVVMPGHIGTEIVANSRKILGGGVMSEAELEQTRKRLTAMGVDAANFTAQDIEKMIEERARRFRDDAPMTAGEAATVILDGVKVGRWRILVGEDARQLDQMVRSDPENAYQMSGIQPFAAQAGGRVGT
jgi:NAD(P)-dependent dehydrogenase (short-subunit alcohol dehydrogenase family)